MLLILSRKGFDSTSGGCPSPILPDGTMVSLPIPDRLSVVTYRDVSWNCGSLGDVVERLTRGRQRATYGAHLDPDVRRDAVPREPGWRPTLGQIGAAQGHLRKQGVGSGDLFPFWGLLRRVDHDLRWAGALEHRVRGWLQVEEVVSVDAVARREPARWRWAARHPHLARAEDRTNTLYVAPERLRLPGRGRRALPGAGSFDVASDAHRLTAPDARSPSLWSLPLDFLPHGRPPLTYHGDASRWDRQGGEARLRAVAKGQEFVLDLDQYAGVAEWATRLIASSGRTA